MPRLNPIAADDESDFSFFQLFTDNGVVNVSIACELVDRIAGKTLGKARRLQFLTDRSDLFGSAAEEKLRAVGFAERIELNEGDFPKTEIGGTA